MKKVANKKLNKKHASQPDAEHRPRNRLGGQLVQHRLGKEILYFESFCILAFLRRGQRAAHHVWKQDSHNANCNQKNNKHLSLLRLTV